VLIYSGDRTRVREEWVSPGQFNHCILAVRVSDETKARSVVQHPSLGRLLVFDATSPTTPVGDLPDHEQGSFALVAAGDGGALVREAASCVGADGMVGGQVVDLLTRAGADDAEVLASRDLKTVALMRLMMTAGALACGAGPEALHALADFGECFGRAYQVCDDVSDETQPCGVTGKPVRQDARHRRPSALNGFGAEGARRFARRLIARGVGRLQEQFGPREEVALLSDAARYVLDSTGAARPRAAAARAREEAIA
jgi:geranylgeranyl pyrophosphate synthase